MNKISITILLIISFSIGLNAQYSIGLYAGSSYCQVKEKVTNDSPFFDLVGPSSSYGINIGLKLERQINNYFSIVGNFSYFNKNAIWGTSKERVNYQYLEPLIGIKIKPTFLTTNKFANNFSIIPSFGYSLKIDKEEQLDNFNSFVISLDLSYSMKSLSLTPFIEWNFNNFSTFQLPAIPEISKYYFTNFGIKAGYALFNGKKK